MRHPLRLEEITGEVLQRWWEKVLISHTGCYEWQGFSQLVKNTLHPRFSINGHIRSPRVIAWFLKTKELPTKHFLRTTCSNNICVSPEHVENVDSIEEAVEAGRPHRLAKGYDEKRRIHPI